jgi:FkbM family methyltransferase
MKQFLRNLFNKFGYDIVKVNVHSHDKAANVHKVKVGNFDILMPGNNPQISNYKYQPDLNKQLARLTTLVHSKYPNLTVIDIGANVGDTIAVIKTQIDIPIIAIEGDDISFSFLQKNVQQFESITPIKQFLGEAERKISVKLNKSGWNTTLIPQSEGTNQLMLKPLDDVLDANGLSERELKLIKIDIEGFDTIVLRGAEKIISKNKPVLYFEYNTTNMNAIKEDGLATLLSLVKYGYKEVIFFDAKNRYVITCPLTSTELITQLHYYVHEEKSQIPYYDLCLFHSEDSDLQDKFINSEFSANKIF